MKEKQNGLSKDNDSTTGYNQRDKKKNDTTEEDKRVTDKFHKIVERAR